MADFLKCSSLVGGLIFAKKLPGLERRTLQKPTSLFEELLLNSKSEKNSWFSIKSFWCGCETSWFGSQNLSKVLTDMERRSLQKPRNYLRAFNKM